MARHSSKVVPVSFTVSAWNNGAFHSTGAGYGLRLSKADRDAIFKPAWTRVVIQLPNGKSAKTVTVELSKSFWDRCSELRSREIGVWLIAHGHAKWGTGVPPTFQLEHVGGNKFALSR